MTMRWEAGSGRLALETAEFEELVAMYERGGTSELFAEELHRLGVLEQGVLVAGVSDALGPVLEPFSRVEVGFVGPEVRRLHQLWLNPSGSSVLTDEGAGLHELAAVHNSGLWVAVADLVGLSPHRLSAQRLSRAQPPAQVPEEVLGGLGSADGEVRRRAAAACAQRLEADNPVAGALAAGEWRAWWVECTWPFVDGTVRSRGVTALDTRPGSLRIDGQTLTPVTSTDLWRELLRLTPSGEELTVVEVEA